MAFVTILGSVWIGLILLKLKTYCWNHCSKIIFKCVNSTVGPIFNEKVTKKWNLWVHEQYIMHCLRQKSQHLWLLFIEQYINSNRVLPKRVKKKKKTQNADGWNAVSKLTLGKIDKVTFLWCQIAKNIASLLWMLWWWQSKSC